MPALADPTPDELAEYFAPEAILAIARRQDFHLRLNADGSHIETDDLIPLWMANAIMLYQPALVDLMRANFLGEWQRGLK